MTANTPTGMANIAIDLQPLHDLVEAFAAERDAMLDACTVNGDPSTLDPDDKATVDAMSAILREALATLDQLQDVAVFSTIAEVAKILALPTEDRS